MENALSDKPENYFTIHQLPILLLYGLGTTSVNQQKHYLLHNENNVHNISD